VLPLGRLTLLPEGSGARGLFTVYLQARDATLRPGPVHQRTVPVRVPAGGLAAAQQKDFVYEVALPAEASPNAMAIAVRDELSGDVAVLRSDGHGG